MRSTLSALALSLVFSAAVNLEAAEAGYYRFPTIRGERVVFTAEGDLWSTSLKGGQATRLTTHPAEENRPAISLDGRQIAFSAAYEGPQEIYVMPVNGGRPQRLSFDGGPAQVLGWTPQGEVLYSTQNATGPAGQRVIVAVHPGTLARRVLPVVDATEACLDDTGRTLFFTRLGLGVTGDNARHYRGGAAAELWRFDLEGGKEAIKFSLDTPAKRPMWWQGRLYFVCDRDGTDNLWSAKADGSELRQLTRHAGWDVRAASLGDGRIVYQQGADLRVFDIARNEDRPLPIELTSDFDQQRERVLRRPLDFLNDVTFAPSGERVVITARGQVAVAGLGSVRRVELALPQGSRARKATLSRDGKWVYAFCDAGGESELWQFPANGGPGGKALTKDKVGQRVALEPSPDGAWIAHTDKPGRLYLLNLATGENRRIDESPDGGYNDLVWSPDSRTLAIVRPDTDRKMDQLLLHNLDTGKNLTLTRDKYAAYSPTFTPDGRWLYFLSDRNFSVTNGSPWGDRNMGPLFNRRARIFALALQDGLRFPFKPKNELDGTESEAKGGKDTKESKPAIQWAGLPSRLFQVPLPGGNYRELKTDGKRLYFLERDDAAEPRTALMSLDFSNPEAQAERFASDVRGYELSADGKKILLVKRGTRGLGDLLILDSGAKGAESPKATVRLDDWNLFVTPKAEWRQMFADAWRMHRDHLYDPQMRGVDWTAIRTKYEPLVDRITDRAELNDLLGQMTGEVGALHSQIRPGELRQAQDGSTPAFLGAVLERVENGYRIAHIYRTDPELPNEASPLARPEVSEGDVITTVNGRPARATRDIADLLRNQAGQQTLLGVVRGKGEAKQIVVTPVNAQRNGQLRYTDWEETCRTAVEAASKGSLGYLHLRAMTGPDLEGFAREFYANIDRQGLIIDVRRNNGGNIDSFIIEKLLRRAWSFWTSPEGRVSGTNMQQAFRGHLVVLIDELTYSDGETFAAAIKALGLAPLVGRRTAGAGVWLGDRNALVDGGMARVAETGQFATKDGEWLIEGVGVAPDIEVVNLPHETFQGKDRQLETAIQMLKDKLVKEPIPTLKPKAIPALRKP